MHVLVTGASGQLGFELTRSVPDGVRVTAVTRSELDLTDAVSIARIVAETRPQVIVNAAAYTMVDRAETDSETAMAVNGDAVRALAQGAAAVQARLIHVSTDFVFGEGAGRPWHPADATAPQSVYGSTKRAGELAVLDTLGAHGLVIRTAWVYSSHGANFVKTMLRLMRERDEVRVIADQVGSPTWARSLAATVWAATAQHSASGIMHFTDAGVASWYDFAVAIQEEALARDMLPRAVPVIPITTADYPTPARRPAYSVLDKTQTLGALGVSPTHWRVNLRLMLDELRYA